ncbi:unnamed protein product [Rotaria sp. Silwood2]|nr:unnamed protein product [Rotaria sp. Silwood2]CAF3081911.1 unnamed protein product [Rotaria sp. Silwood2]CAF3992173.1 unnamed protein product [Rotaria sp. Silwood2]CAF4353448.1 unnamed protein product [Rotaria sp. Silwood2]CAF4358274.1 unnamed protein product [Rotaria sp. Silwood2]
MEQARLQAYYDNFPNIDDATSSTGLDIMEAIEFTQSILRTLPSGNVTERSTMCHVLTNLFANQNMQCLFFDSAHGKNLHDASRNLAEIDLEDRPFVLKLNSSEGLRGNMQPKTENGVIKLARILSNAINQNQSHPLMEDIRKRLAKAHNISRKDINFKTVYVGSFNVVYTLKNSTNISVESLVKVREKLKNQFEEFISSKIHPLFYRPSFDISFFDERGNKTFPSKAEIHEVGPPGCTEKYFQPAKWTRYGLNVIGKYEDGDTWLDPFLHPGNWYRAFHGTGNARSEDFGHLDQCFDDKYAPVNALANIYENGFNKARIAVYGAGVYCSPNPKIPEKQFTKAVDVNTQLGKKKFKCMLQVAVNPNGVRFVKQADIWVVPNPQDIRPYGILIKEV